MLGNDVVDLAAPGTRPGARHSRFDERVFCAAELRALSRSLAPERLRWRLWAAKEACYKAARRRDAAARFSPRRFEVRRADLPRCAVRWGDRDFCVSIEESADFVHAVATEGRADGCPGACGVGQVAARAACGAARGVEEAAARAACGAARLEASPDPEAPGRAARALALSGVAAHLGVDPCELSIARVDRMPWLHHRGVPARAVLSLSHHGRYAAWAVALAPGSAPGAVL